MSQIAALRILDASLNRATEGLRVVEDFTRFVLDDCFLTNELKSIRHDLVGAATRVSSSDRHTARDTAHDVGTRITTEREAQRADTWDVCAASLKRTQQSLRSLEEYGKLVNVEFAGRCESLRYRLYTLEKALDIVRTSRDRLAKTTLCVLMDGGPSVESFEVLVRALVEAGIGMIQLRDKRLGDRELIDRARALVTLTRRQPPALPGVGSTDRQEPPAEPGAAKASKSSTLAIINNRADIAAIVGADGVHIGQEDLSVKDARAIVGPRALVGVSTHNIDQARAAVLDGANYLGAGPTFASRTKTFDRFAGLDYLRAVAGEIRLPSFAIGGISAKNIRDVLSTGISRVAVGAAVIQADNPSVAISQLISILHEASASEYQKQPTHNSVETDGCAR